MDVKYSVVPSTISFLVKTLFDETGEAVTKVKSARHETREAAIDFMLRSSGSFTLPIDADDDVSENDMIARMELSSFIDRRSSQSTCQETCRQHSENLLSALYEW